MEQVSGFIALDGKFFLSEEECKRHEVLVKKFRSLKSKTEALVAFFRNGEELPPEFPETLSETLKDFEEDERIDLWNDFLVHLFFERDGRIFYEDLEKKSYLHDVFNKGKMPEVALLVGAFMDKVRLAFAVTAFLLDVE